MQTLQLTVGSASRLKFEAMGLFDRSCGYLAKEEHLEGLQCPNPWHVVADFLASALLFGALVSGVLIFVFTLSGVFYRMPTSRWATRVFFGKHLKAPALRAPERSPATRDGSRGARSVPLAAKPVLGLAVTLGIWSSRSSSMFACGTRQHWYEPVETADSVRGEGGGSGDAPGADFVSWKAMYMATAKSIALMWTPMPVFGALLGKTTLYLNQHVLLAFGEEAVGDSDDAKAIIHHFLEERSRFAQAIQWSSQAVLVIILVVIEFDLPDRLTPEERLRALGACVLVVLGIAVCRIISDMFEQLATFKSSQGLASCVEVILADLLPKHVVELVLADRNSPNDPLRDFSDSDRQRSCAHVGSSWNFNGFVEATSHNINANSLRHDGSAVARRARSRTLHCACSTRVRRCREGKRPDG